jgi:hypothetical protein
VKLTKWERLENDDDDNNNNNNNNNNMRLP